MRIFRESHELTIRTWECGAVIVAVLIALMGPCYAQGTGASPLLSANQLQDLVAPIALYPDSLLAQIFPASTLPAQVVEAARYLQSKGGKVSGMPDTDWDPSVKALLQFPQVLYKMNDDLDWTSRLGDAVIGQQDDVLSAIQAFRQTVYNAGNLKSNDQMTVSASGTTIIINSPSPEVVYVPQYDPVTVVNTGSWAAPLITFGVGVAVGSWINYNNFDWAHHAIIVNPVYHPYFNYHPWSPYYPPPRVGYGTLPAWHPAPEVRTAYYNRNAAWYNSNAAKVNVNNINRTTINTTNINNANVNRTNINNANVNRTNINNPHVNKTNINNPHVNKTNINNPHVNKTNANRTNINNAFRVDNGSVTRSYTNRGSYSRSSAGGSRRR